MVDYTIGLNMKLYSCSLAFSKLMFNCFEYRSKPELIQYTYNIIYRLTVWCSLGSDQLVSAISKQQQHSPRNFPLDFRSVSDHFIQMSQSCSCYFHSGTSYSHREKTILDDFVLELRTIQYRLHKVAYRLS